MRRLIVATLGAAGLALASCASLAWGPNDSAGTKTAKTLVRIPLGVATIGWSEAFIKTYRQLDEFRAFVEQRRSEISEARDQAVRSETEAEYRKWAAYADRLQSELDAALQRVEVDREGAQAGVDEAIGKLPAPTPSIQCAPESNGTNCR